MKRLLLTVALLAAWNAASAQPILRNSLNTNALGTNLVWDTSRFLTINGDAGNPGVFSVTSNSITTAAIAGDVGGSLLPSLIVRKALTIQTTKTNLLATDASGTMTNVVYGTGIAWDPVTRTLSATASGGDTVWTNDNGTLYPVDFPTNVVFHPAEFGAGTAFAFDAVEAPADLAFLLSMKQQGTNKFRVFNNGALTVGANTEAFWGTPVGQNGEALVVYRDKDAGDDDNPVIYAAAKFGTDTGEAKLDPSPAQADLLLRKKEGAVVNQIELHVGPSVATMATTVADAVKFRLESDGTLSIQGQTNVIGDNGTALTFNGVPISSDTTATNIVTLTQTGTNAAQLDFALVARGGVFKLSLTNNAYFGAPANLNNTDFKHCWLAVKQPSTGTCLVTFTNGFFAQPGGLALVNDTNAGAVVWYEMVSNPFTNGIVDVWMSQKSQLVP